MKSKLNLLNSNQSDNRILPSPHTHPNQTNNSSAFINNRSLRNNDANYEKYDPNHFKRISSNQFVPDPQKIIMISPSNKYQPNSGSPCFKHKNEEMEIYPKPVLQYRHSVDFVYENNKRQEGMSTKVCRKNEQTQISFQASHSMASNESNHLKFKPLQFRNLGAYEFITMKKNENPPSHKSTNQFKKYAPRMSLNQQSQRYADYDYNEKKKSSKECYSQQFNQIQQKIPAFNSKSSLDDTAKQCSLYNELQLQDEQKTKILGQMQKLKENEKSLKMQIQQKNQQIQKKDKQISHLHQELSKLKERSLLSDDLEKKIEEFTLKLSETQQKHQDRIEELYLQRQMEIQKVNCEANDKISSMQREKNRVIDQLIFKCCEKDDVLQAQEQKFRREAQQTSQQFIWKMQQLIQMLQIQISEPEQETTAESVYFKFLQKFTDFIQKSAHNQEKLKQEYKELSQTNNSLIALNTEQNMTIAEFKNKIIKLECQWNQLRNKMRDNEAYAFDLNMTLQQTNSQLLHFKLKQLNTKYKQSEPNIQILDQAYSTQKLTQI